MDGLRPEVDELDRFNKRNTSKTKLKPSSGQGQHKERASKSSGGSLIIWVLIIALSVGFGWFSWQQQSKISRLEARLSDASGFMDQSKLLIARLEGKLSETGVELAETGTAAEKKLAFLDSEVRKLWGVSYDRNRKTIETNQKELDALKAKMNRIEKANASSIKRIDQSLSDLSDSLKQSNTAMESRLGAVENEVSVLRMEQASVNEAFEKQLSEQKALMDRAAKESQSYLEQAAKLDLSIESINASRRQLNERIVDLDKKINALQLKK